MDKTIDIRHIYQNGRKRGRRLISKRSIGGIRFWRSLQFAQRCYLIATGMLLTSLYFNFDSTVFDTVMYSFVLVGIVNEIWPRFMVVWNSLPGKAVILFVYAVIANFALASASGMVNEVAGVSAGALPYSHNFALILMMPSWFFLTSIMALLAVTLLMPLYLLALLALKPIGVKRFWHAPDYRFVFTTALVRYVWTLALLLEISLLVGHMGLIGDIGGDGSNDYVSINHTNDELVVSGQRDEGEQTIEQSNGNTPEQANGHNEEIAHPVKQSKVEGKRNAENDSDDGALIEGEQQVTQGSTRERESWEEELYVMWNEADEKNKAFRLSQRKLLADFIYEFEADTRSRCAHDEHSRVIELNDYEILDIRKKPEAELGFDYQVVKCVSAAIGQ